MIDVSKLVSKHWKDERDEVKETYMKIAKEIDVELKEKRKHDKVVCPVVWKNDKNPKNKRSETQRKISMIMIIILSISRITLQPRLRIRRNLHLNFKIFRFLKKLHDHPRRWILIPNPVQEILQIGFPVRQLIFLK